MREYEVVFIVHPDLDDNAFKEIVDRVQGWIKDAGGKVTKVDLWGRKKMAYMIRKQREGQYVLLKTELNPNFVDELERNLQLLESVLRYMVKQAIELPSDAK